MIPHIKTFLVSDVSLTPTNEARTCPTHIITLNYVIFSNYYISGVGVSVSRVWAS